MNLLKNKTSKQTIILFASQILMIAIGFGIKTIQTKVLGPEQYGLYSFFTTFTVFIALFFRFGFDASLQVLLAENEDSIKEKELFGLGVVINILIGLIYALSIWVFSFYIDAYFNVKIGNTLRVLAPLVFVIPVRSFIYDMAIGSNKINVMPVYDVVSKVLFLIILLSIVYWSSITLYQIICINLLTLIVAFIVAIKQLNPSFKNMALNFNLLWIKNKTFGFKYYLGSTLNQSTFKLDELAISYFINTTINGFYTLANVIASPIVLGSQALSSSLFKKFSSQNKIPKKVFYYNTIWLLVSLLLLNVLVDEVVELLFGDAFKSVSEYAFGLSIAFFFQGLCQPFNFLTAHSNGNAVRNVAIVEAIINIIGCLIFIPSHGVYGAIYTSIFAKFIHFIGKWYYYKKYLKPINS